jgi:hypothetical protein
MEELSFLKVCGPFRTVQQFKKNVVWYEKGVWTDAAMFKMI